MKPNKKKLAAAMRQQLGEMIRLGLVEVRADGKFRMSEKVGLIERDADGKMHVSRNFDSNLASLLEQPSKTLQ